MSQRLQCGLKRQALRRAVAHWQKGQTDQNNQPGYKQDALLGRADALELSGTNQVDGKAPENGQQTEAYEDKPQLSLGNHWRQ